MIATYRAGRTAGLALAATLALACAAAAPAGAADQPWGFEQITPPNKGGGSVLVVDTFTASPDGNTFLYTASAPFQGVPAESSPQYTRYVGIRGADGWRNRGMDPLFDGLSGALYDNQELIGASSDLAYVLVTSSRALTPGATEGGSNLYVRDTRTGDLTLAYTSTDLALTRLLTYPQGGLSIRYLAQDGRSGLLLSTRPLTPGAPSGPTVLYRWTVGGGIEPVSVLPDAEGGATVGVSSTGRDTEYGVRDSLSYDDALTHVYFGEDGGSGGVYVRSGNETQAVSVSHIPGDPTTPVHAQIDSITDSGRYVLFHTFGTRLTTTTPTDVALANASFLYRYDATDNSLAYISATAGNVGVQQMTQDGQTVAFQSTYALAGAAVDGAVNLYVWRRGSLHYVETADAGFPQGSPMDLSTWLRLLSPDGRYFSFTDNSASTARRFGYDNASSACPMPLIGGPGPCSQVYLYDADAHGGDGQLVCVSCRSDGAPPQGDAGDPTTSVPGFIRLNGHQAQTVTDDGTVFFTSLEALVSADSNGLNDVYAYRDGQLRLVSRAAQGASARFLDATPDGTSVFFSTNDPIVATDTDRSADIYVARQGGGFSYTAPVVAPPCSGSDCRDLLAPPATVPVAGSVSFHGAGNVAGTPASAGRVSVSTVRTIVGASGLLKVTVPGKGALAASGSGLKSVRRTAAKAATYTMRISLTARARQAMQKTRSAKKKVRLTFTPSGGPASTVTLSLTYKASAAKKKGR
jgi:hypothetical protein